MVEISMNLMQSSSPPSSFSSSEGSDDPPSHQICSSSSCHGRSFGFRLLPKSPRSKLHSPKRMKAKGISSSRPTRMQTSQKTPNGSAEENPGEICSCVTAFSADCAAICCCPLVLLHLLALVIFRLPEAIAIKLTARLKKKLRRNTNHSISKENACTSHNLTSPWAEYFTEEIEDPPAVGFQDEFLREYFECKQLGFGGMS